MNDKTYHYYLFFILPKLSDGIASMVISRDIKYLYGYTNKKSEARGFLKIHKKQCFIMREFDLSKADVCTLAKYSQSNIIRKFHLKTKGFFGETTKVDVCMTEKEYSFSEGRCYLELEDIFKYVWEPNSRLQRRYRKALDLLQYTKLNKMIDEGGPLLLPNIEADIFSAFIHLFKEVVDINENLQALSEDEV